MKRFVVETVPAGCTEWARLAVFEREGPAAAQLAALALAGATARVRIDDSAERMGPNVTGTVRAALGRLSEAAAALVRARAADDKWGGEGRYEWETWESVRGEVARANHTLDYFESFCPQNGVLVADVYDRLGARVRPRLSGVGAEYGRDAEAGALGRGGKRAYRAVAVELAPLGPTESHDEARARYEAALAEAGWGHAESELSEARLDALVRGGGDRAKLVKNYRTGVISGGELDMKLAQLDGQVA